MHKKIEDYLPFYLGCECECIDSRNEGEVWKGELIEVGLNMACIETENANDPYIEVMPFEVKPFLRNINEIKESEIQSLKLTGWCHVDEDGEFVCDVNGGYEPHEMSDILIKLRKAGFDCDKLIECGLAIDKNTLQNA